MRKYTVLIVAICTIFLSACAVISKKDCINTDWEAKGFEDGASGRYSATVHSHHMHEVVKKCKEYNVPVKDLYDKGYKEGLAQYCVPSLAKSYGKSGQEIPKVCDTAKFPKLIPAWNSGLDEYCTPSNFENWGKSGQNIKPICNKHRYGSSKFYSRWEKGVSDFCSYDLGYSTGDKGDKPHQLCKREKHNNFYRGWDKGVRAYFSDIENAFELGKKGEEIRIECPTDLKTNFWNSYKRGEVIYFQIKDIETKLINTETDIKNNEIEKNNLESEISDKYQKINTLNQKLTDLSEESIQISSSENPDLNRIYNIKIELAEAKRDISSINNIEIPKLKSKIRSIDSDLFSLKQQKVFFETKLMELQHTK